MINLLSRCGIGDIISHLTRIDSIKDFHKDNDIKFWLGGYGDIPKLCKDLLTFNGIDSEIVKGWNSLQQNDMIKKWIEGKTAEKVVDLNFEQDIFSNKIPDFYRYNMKFPFNFKGEEFKDDFLETGNVIGLQIKTTTGASDFDHNGKRFWPIENWKKLIDIFVMRGFKVAIFGGKNDSIDIKEDDKFIKSYCGKINVNQTIYAIRKCSRFVGTNSWMWEVAAFSGIQTVCLYFTNTFFLSLHIPFCYSDIHKNLFVETNSKITPEQVFESFNYNENAKISACVITQDEAALLDKCLANIKGYVDEIVIVDGGSSDNSVDIASKYTDKIFFRKFDNHMNQKNFAIEHATHDWILIEDTDEYYEYGFLNNMKRYISQNSTVDMFMTPRINIIEDLDEDLVKKYGFNVQPFFKWINYPDSQERLFKSHLRHSVHPVHHHVIGYQNAYFVYGLHSIHIKNKSKQIFQNERYKEIEKEWKQN